VHGPKPKSKGKNPHFLRERGRGQTVTKSDYKTINNESYYRVRGRARDLRPDELHNLPDEKTLISRGRLQGAFRFNGGGEGDGLRLKAGGKECIRTRVIEEGDMVNRLEGCVVPVKKEQGEGARYEGNVWCSGGIMWSP